MTNPKASEIERFRTRFRGEVLLPRDAGYDDARQVWNAMIDRKPAIIARCTSAGDVAEAVTFGREKALLVSVRGGGHHIAGNAVCDDGLVIDLSPMKTVRVNPAARRVAVQGGCTLAEVDAATRAHGLVTPLGINSTTGVAGLTLGGGFGWLTRRYGMTVDNLVSADVVTADGRHVRASESENADLFWGLRGGGGNFGVVTSFEFQLHPFGPDVLSGLIVFPFDQAKTVLSKFVRFTETMPDEFNVWVVVRKAPPLPFLPESAHGREILVLALCHAGDPVQGEALVEPLRKFGTPLGEHVGVQPFVAWQRAFDPLLAPGARNYWKSHNFARVNGPVLDAVVEFGSRLPAPDCEILLAVLGGEAGRVAPDATAYASRDARYVMNVHGRWESEAEDARGIAWARELFARTQPHASGGAYINFLTHDEGGRVAAAYGPAYRRLAEVKRKYDPDNFFRVNQNVKPT